MNRKIILKIVDDAIEKIIKEYEEKQHNTYYACGCVAGVLEMAQRLGLDNITGLVTGFLAVDRIDTIRRKRKDKKATKKGSKK